MSVVMTKVDMSLGDTQAPYTVRMSLPASMSSTNARTIWSSKGAIDLPAAIKPMRLQEETTLMGVLIDELNTKLGVGLAPRTNHAKDPNSSKAGFLVNLITMGNAHAKNISD